MYRRPILCTLYGAVDFLNVLKKGCWGGGGGVFLVHNEIHYVPIGDGWEHYVPVLHYVPITLGYIKLPMYQLFLWRLYIIMYRAIKTTGTLIVKIECRNTIL